MTQTVRSADGTRIGFERLGEGPPLILVEAAGHYRGLSSFTGLTPLLAEEFTVYTYDRRGRGASGDADSYAPVREVEDLAALIEDAGGQAHLYGYSSGALLAMHAAAGGLEIGRLALMEPPLQEGDGTGGPDPLTLELADLVARGLHSEAVERFHASIGVPSEFIAELRSTPDWRRMEEIAPTLVYDCMLSDATTEAVISAVGAPTLVLDSFGSDDQLGGWAESVAERLPSAVHRSLTGEWHSVPESTLAPVLIEFFTAARD